jgi:O-antigen/teichoic acid export membrane protein
VLGRLTELWRSARTANRFAAHASLNAVANIFQAVIGVITGIAAARLLGPHGRGELAAIQNFPGALGMLACIGMPEALLYYCARDPTQAGSYTGSAVALALLASVPFVVTGWLLMPWMLHAERPAIIAMGRVYLAIVPVYVVSLFLVPLRATSNFVPWNLLRTLPNISWLAVLIGAWFAGRATATFLASASLFSVALLDIFYAFVTLRRVDGSFVPRLRHWSGMLRYGFPCMMTGVPQFLNLRLDQMLMAAFIPPRALGLYVAAVAWSAAPAPLLNAIGFVIVPAVAAEASDPRGVRRIAAGGRAAVALALVTCTLAMAATPLAITLLFGTRFRAGIPAALILVPASGVLGVNYVFEEGLRAMGRPYSVLGAELFGLVVTALALLLLLRPLGINGAALASLLGYSAVGVALLFSVCDSTGTALVTLLVPQVAELRQGLALLAAAWRGVTTGNRRII